MKNCILLYFLVTGILNAGAQVPYINNMVAGTAGCNKHITTKDNDFYKTILPESLFQLTGIAVSKGEITLKNLPEEDSITTCITNANGDVCAMKAVSIYDKSIDIDALPRGIYCIRLFCKDKCRKAFLLQL